MELEMNWKWSEDRNEFALVFLADSIRGFWCGNPVLVVVSLFFSKGGVANGGKWRRWSRERRWKLHYFFRKCLLSVWENWAGNNDSEVWRRIHSSKKNFSFLSTKLIWRNVFHFLIFSFSRFFFHMALHNCKKSWAKNI